MIDLKTKNKTSTPPPTLKFYASTSRFLQRIKNLLSAITRPIKRGRLFLAASGDTRTTGAALKPRKPTLSRHFRCVRLTLDMPALHVVYWSSASEENGMQLECEQLKLTSTYRLDLMPFEDGLRRRPRPVWSVDLLKFNIKHTNVYLMSPPTPMSPQAHTATTAATANNQQAPMSPVTTSSTNSAINAELWSSSSSSSLSQQLENNGAANNNSSTATRNFFMHVASINYERATLTAPAAAAADNSSSSSDNKCQPKQFILVRNLKAMWNNVNRDVLFNLYEIYNKSKRLRHNISSLALKPMIATRQAAATTTLASTTRTTAAATPVALADVKKTRTKSSSGMSTSSAAAAAAVAESEENSLEELLERLESERRHTPVIHCDEKANQVNSNVASLLYGPQAASDTSDIHSESLFIEFVNSQIKLCLAECASTMPTAGWIKLLISFRYSSFF